MNVDWTSRELTHTYRRSTDSAERMALAHAGVDVDAKILADDECRLCGAAPSKLVRAAMNIVQQMTERAA